jgi:hypothetical protein
VAESRSRALPLGTSGLVALVDAPAYTWLCQYSWAFDGRNAYRWRVVAGQARRCYLAHAVLGCPAGRGVLFRNGDPLDCRRANLAPVGGRMARGRRRAA